MARYARWMGKRPYHHGDLRRALLDAAVEVIEESGPTALSLRDLARRADVSHAAPQHHFGDKAGLLTANGAAPPLPRPYVDCACPHGGKHSPRKGTNLDETVPRRDVDSYECSEQVL